MKSTESLAHKTKVLFIGPVPPPYSGPEMGMRLFLDSSLGQTFDIVHIKTNVRSGNENKGRLDAKIIAAFFRFNWTLLKEIIQHRPVLAYYPVTPTQVGWIGRDCWCLLICRLFRVKTVIHMRGSHFRLNFEKFRPVAKSLVRVACKKVSLALVQAEYLKDQFTGLVPDDRIRVLYNAIDSTNYQNHNVSEYEPLRILFIGHLTKAKGYCELVNVIPTLAARFPNVEVHFAGTMRRGERGVFFDQTTGNRIEYEDPFVLHERISNSEYSANYVNHGVVSGDAKNDLIRSCALYVSPSFSEGFSRALLEAMCMGKAIVCTPVGAHREVLRDGQNAIFVAPGDSAGLAEAILTLLDDKETRDAIGRRNHAYVRSDFDIVKIAARLEELLSEVIAERSGGFG